MNAQVELVGILSSSLWNKTRFDVASVVLSILFQVYHQLVSIGSAYNAVEDLLARHRMSAFPVLMSAFISATLNKSKYTIHQVRVITHTGFARFDLMRTRAVETLLNDHCAVQTN